ncbi:MAG: hypothetical protein IKL04_03745 [Lachnospiraceae bacterium]|nr:hypothetical protein [Lachnospiraceae bacterium]
MLDSNITLFDFQLPAMQANATSAMVVGGCNAYVGNYIESKKRGYSELEENNYAYLNSNDYSGKVFEIEICLQSNDQNIYSEFYARCFSVRTDNNLCIKINGWLNDKHYTKMNMNNQVVMGLGIFLKDEEYGRLLEANLILIEGFFAMRKPTNTYGIAIQLEKKDDAFKPRYANTYKMKQIKNINNLAH